ncbi:hypothetical protein HanRHA438_Chr14g0630531 [Helianthus annuus]|uniref:Uncharacterized protein n=1 Tax=Helianthus annuus TaxID=4232 RepID=A0A9K3E6L9_HELAN|nr:hypothetical protein HanXRQr2_Chr14g0620691 [Helianthus annuus]KAJ0851751.1 hypothetical protein HanRHA438_Chr14g0630531 [Helianthus annuus]
MYLQAQLKNMIVAWLSVFQFAIHILLSLLFVYKLNLGVSGAMLALIDIQRRISSFND